MNNTKFKIKIIISACLIIIGLTLIVSSLHPTFRVGECVRELGYGHIEKVTTIGPSGLLETINVSPESGLKGMYYIYKKSQQERLIRVECPK